MAMKSAEQNRRKTPEGKAEQKRVMDDQVRFLKSWIEHPLKTGAVAPSSKELAAAMAEVIDPAVPGPVIELGPGTGVVTEAIIARGIAPERIVAIEFNADFIPHLESRCPGVRFLHGDAYAVASLVRAVTQETAAATVSSLPLFTEPSEKRIAMVTDCFWLMHPNAPFIQFSYALVSPVPKKVHGMTHHISDWVLKNVPPARVWTYRRQI
jgi:phosphatidylethanolamine/phosphatidyl-N-methylethanolamine N-methyltransferase